MGIGAGFGVGEFLGSSDPVSVHDDGILVGSGVGKFVGSAADSNVCRGFGFIASGASAVKIFVVSLPGTDVLFVVGIFVDGIVNSGVFEVVISFIIYSDISEVGFTVVSAFDTGLGSGVDIRVGSIFDSNVSKIAAFLGSVVGTFVAFDVGICFGTVLRFSIFVSCIPGPIFVCDVGSVDVSVMDGTHSNIKAQSCSSKGSSLRGSVTICQLSCNLSNVLFVLP